MTAFAQAHASQPWGSLTWEIRSINHRYLELHFRLPDALRDIEQSLRETARAHVQRGKVDCYLQLVIDHSTSDIGIDQTAARRYVSACETIAKLIDDPAPLNPLQILDRPGVIAEDPSFAEDLKQVAQATYATALTDLGAGRLREGEKLAAFIKARLEEIRRHVLALRSDLPALRAAQQRKITDKLAEFGDRLDQDRLEQELVYLAQKTDVDEELDRLDTHVDEVAKVLAQDKPAGRRLDFLLQELNREANTLAAKANAGSTTYAAVDLKVLIEQIREQIQNLE